MDLETLAGRIGHAFARPELAQEAFTHRAALDRRADLKAAFPHGNERLEFLGDRVLSLAMADLLLCRFPKEAEGLIARRHAALVSTQTLGEIAEAIGLADFRVGRSDALPATQAILADQLEALLGAVFLDGGFTAAAALIERLWGDRLAATSAAPQPPKTRLQEWAQARGLALPVYKVVGREGAEHAPVFTIEVRIGSLPPGRGSGATKRAAESAAAEALFDQLVPS